VAAAPVFDEVMKSIWEVADFPHGPPPLAGIFATHFLSIAIFQAQFGKWQGMYVCTEM
jgi:hypothetical protein